MTSVVSRKKGDDIRRKVKRLVSGSGRRYLGGKLLGHLGFCTSWAVDVRGGSLEWIEVVEVDLHLKDLGSGFHGRRIIHVSDLHCSRTVSSKYLRHCIKRINQLAPDIVVLTGDYVTCDIYGRFREKVADLLGDIRSRLGVFASLGNHDYGLDVVLRPAQEDHVRQMIAGLADSGINVLRNESHVLELDGRPLWLVGLGDVWADDFEPEKAFTGISRDGAVIALTHNPATMRHLKGFHFDAAFSGHTHGLRAQLSRTFDWPILHRHDYHAGMYHLGRKKLYVNRGLGRLGKCLFNTKPEITVFNLC